MKAAFCTNVFNPEEMEEKVAALSGLGYDGVEFWQQYLDNHDIEHVKAILDKNGMRAAQVCPYFDFTDNEERRLESIELGKNYVEIAGRLECRNIRVFTGGLSSRDASRELWRHAASALRKLCDFSPGTNFVLETHPGSLMDTSASTLELLSLTARDNLKVNLQVPLADGEDVFESARKLGKYTCHLHAHNWNRRRKDEPWHWKGDELTFLSGGDYDFKEFVALLKNEGFDGYISIEHPSHGGKHDPMETAEKEIVFLKVLIMELGQR